MLLLQKYDLNADSGQFHNTWNEHIHYKNRVVMYLRVGSTLRRADVRTRLQGYSCNVSLDGSTICGINPRLTGDDREYVADSPTTAPWGTGDGTTIDDRTSYKILWRNDCIQWMRGGGGEHGHREIALSKQVDWTDCVALTDPNHVSVCTTPHVNGDRKGRYEWRGFWHYFKADDWENE